MDAQESAIHTAGRILSDRDTSEQSTSCARKEVSEVVAGMGDNGPPVEDVEGLWPYSVYGGSSVTHTSSLPIHGPTDEQHRYSTI